MKTIYVYENWLSETPSLIGKLYIETVRGGENYSFEYDASWLSDPTALATGSDFKHMLTIIVSMCLYA